MAHLSGNHMIGRAEPTLAARDGRVTRGGMSGGQVKRQAARGHKIDDSPELFIIAVHSDQPQTNAWQARRVPLAEPDDRMEVGVAGGNETTKACNARRRAPRPAFGRRGTRWQALRASGTASFFVRSSKISPRGELSKGVKV